MEAHPARTFWCEARKLERVRCSSLIDWPVYPRFAHNMRASNDAQCGATARHGGVDAKQPRVWERRKRSGSRRRASRGRAVLPLV